LKNKIIVALDVTSKREALKLVDALSPLIKIFKIGSVPFTSFGPDIIKEIRKRGGRVFFDALKKSVNRWAFEESLKVAKIIPTTLGEDAVAAGAAALILQKIFAKIG